MSALVPTRGLADSLAELFDPVDAAPIEALLAEHRERVATISRLAATFADAETLAALPYLVKGAEISDSYHAERMFAPEQVARAHKALDADFWQRALDATDVLSVMPASRRDEWRKQIEKLDVPEFSDAALRSTLAEHLASRHRYFAERVDGLFRSLSPDHRTNLASGFRSKMIINYMTDGDAFVTSNRVDVLVDLRVVVARFMGRPEDGSYTLHMLTRNAVGYARRECRGEWVTLDGGAIEIKCHKSGTCHVRVHDEIAWRLNAVLASVNPGAIPESNRTRPAYTGKHSKTASKTPTLFTRPLPFPVLRLLAEYENRSRDLGKHEWQCGYSEWNKSDKHVRREALAVLASIGAVVLGDGDQLGRVRFDYDATDVLKTLVASGCVPDQKAHQFYPTPPALAARVVELAEIGPDDVVLEPSAGQGAIAELLPIDRTVCVEASALHCEVLRAKGFGTLQGDFLQARAVDIGTAIAHELPGPVGSLTRVVMNPPFDRGQWKAHVEHAARMLSPRRGARLVAILPASAPSKLDLPGFDMTWSEPISGAFAGTNISVVILTAVRQ